MIAPKSFQKRGWPVWPWRRLTQLTVLFLLGAFPLTAVYTHYLSTRRLEKKMERWEGAFQGNALALADAAVRIGIPDGEGGVPTRRPRKAILERTRDYTGSPWAARVAGVPLTDPLAGAESAAASRALPWILVSGLLGPLIATFLLGRVYCGWICPMGFLSDMAAKLRGLLVRGLELKLPEVHVRAGTKYLFLGVGLVLSALTGFAVLHYLYPPAILSREVHGFVTAQFDRAEEGLLGVALAGLTGASVFVLVLLLVEVFVAPNLWCRSLCPGGALYSLLGKFRLLRIRRIAPACTHCAICDKVCPRGLFPMTDRAGMECDNCGVCIDVCPFRALKYGVALTGAPVDPPARTYSGGIPRTLPVGRLALMILTAGPLLFAGGKDAYAHHIIGIPHYAYDENYPQAPVLKLKEQVGPWKFQLTSFPGRPEPGTRAQLTVFVRKEGSGELLDVPLNLTLRRQRILGGPEVVYGPADGHRSENVFKYSVAYPEEGNYEVTLSFDDGPIGSTLTFPIVAGDPGNPWVTLGGFSGGLVLLILAVRAAKIKIVRRRAREEAVPA